MHLGGGKSIIIAGHSVGVKTEHEDAEERKQKKEDDNDNEKTASEALTMIFQVKVFPDDAERLDQALPYLHLLPID